MIDISLNNSAAAAAAAAANAAQTQEETQTAAAQTTLAPILGGENVKVTTPGVDVDKLVAQLKNESDETNTTVAKMKISSVLTLLESMNVRLTAAQQEAFAAILALDEKNAAMEKEIASIYKKYGISSDVADTATAMDAAIETLQKAVERAVQEGKDHQKAVQEAKRIRDDDRAKLERLQNAETKDAAAIKAAEEALAASQATLDAATALAAGDAAAVSAAQTAVETAKADKARIGELKSKIASSAADASAAISALGDKALESIAAALAARVTAQDATTGQEPRVSPAEEEKRELAEIAHDPLKAIRDALARMDESILKTIGENRELKA